MLSEKVVKIGFRVSLAWVALINFMPVLGLFSSEGLSQAYGVIIDSPELLILLKHRALLFGLLGGLVTWSLFKPSIQKEAMIMAGISMLGFAVLMHWVETDSDALRQVLMADYLGLLFLTLAMVFYRLKQ